MKQPERYVEPRLTQYLFDRASRTLTPLSGTFELSPVCNLACKMCYVRKTPAEVAASPRPPVGLIQWLSIAEQARDAGMLYLLLTGDYESRDIVPLMIEMWEFIRDFEGDVPGASPRDCGNYLDMNLPMAKYLAKKYLDQVLYDIKEERLVYPK